MTQTAKARSGMQHLRKVFLLPSLLSGIYLIAIVFDERVHHAFNTFPLVYGPLLLTLLMPGGFAVAAIVSSSRTQTLRRAALLSVCAVTPFAVFYPWVIIPGNLGLATGDFLFFLGWLVKYPNLGPINIKVFLGIFCMILASFLPPFFACTSINKASINKVSAILLAIDIAVAIPLFVNLDRSLLLFGIFGYAWLDGETYLRNFFLAIGPLLRLTALAIAVFVMLEPVLCGKRPRNV